MVILIHAQNNDICPLFSLLVLMRWLISTNNLNIAQNIEFLSYITLWGKKKGLTLHYGNIENIFTGDGHALLNECIWAK